MMPLWKSMLLMSAVFGAVGGLAGLLRVILDVIDNQTVLAAASALGCYGICAVVALVFWAWGTVLMEQTNRPPSYLTFAATLLLVPGLMTWGLYYLVHEVVGSHFVIRASEGVGCVLTVVLILVLLNRLREWSQQRG